MPNWVYNEITLTFSGEEDASNARKYLTGSEDGDVFSFEKILPRPEDESDWYNWNIANWGTKWDAARSEVIKDEAGVLVYRFDTAWSPPFPVIKALSAKYSTAPIKMVFEEEQGWGGVAEALDGEISIVKEWDIPETHAEVVNRGGECGCDDARSWYGDCFYEQAKKILGDDSSKKKMLEFIKAMSSTWEGDVSSLIDASSRIDKEVVK
ncbi:MAG: hypothetical protein ACKOW9_03075 [Candidatus Paceibacterota bacterium]